MKEVIVILCNIGIWTHHILQMIEGNVILRNKRSKEMSMTLRLANVADILNVYAII